MGWGEAESAEETQRKATLTSIWGIRGRFLEEMASELRGSRQRKEHERKIYAELRHCIRKYMVETCIRVNPSG